MRRKSSAGVSHAKLCIQIYAALFECYKITDCSLSHSFDNLTTFKGVIFISYINAEKVLPDWLITQVRSYVGDGLIYIPPETTTRKAWGSKSGTKKLLEARNLEIRAKKQTGVTVSCLAMEYHLSEDTIKRILYR